VSKLHLWKKKFIRSSFSREGHRLGKQTKERNATEGKEKGKQPKIKRLGLITTMKRRIYSENWHAKKAYKLGLSGKVEKKDRTEANYTRGRKPSLQKPKRDEGEYMVRDHI